MSVEDGLSFIAYKHIRTTQHGEACQTEGRPYILAMHPVKHKAHVFRARCKLWACPSCAEINRQEWVFRALAGSAQLIETVGQISFLTLTSHRALDMAGSEAVFGDAWNKLNRRASRASGGGEYFCVPERHKDGRVHAHYLETFNLGWDWWHKNAPECGLGWKVDEQPARAAAAAAAYASKYMSKQLDGREWPKGWRHVRTSQGWPKAPEEIKDERWQFVVMQTETGALSRLDNLAGCGWRVRVFL